MPRISIITPLHNKGPFVAETLASVQAQTFADWEMIVVENHSSDNGPAQVEHAASQDDRILLLRASDSVRGPCAARNLGLCEARGEWVLFWMQMIYWIPHTLRGCLANRQRLQRRLWWRLHGWNLVMAQNLDRE